MTQPSHKSLFWTLLLLAILLYLACMPWMELRCGDEAVYATVAREMLARHNFLHPTFQGEDVSIFPLYPWLICLCSGFQKPCEFSVRLPAVLAVFGMAFQAYQIARRHRDEYSGLLAALIVLTSFGTMKAGIFAQTETLHACLLSGAWFRWHTMGVLRGRWKTAWATALGLVALDVLNVGLRAALLFYLPFLFTAMPPRTRRLLRMREHLQWLTVYTLGLYLWIAIFCPQPMMGWNSFVGPLAKSAAPEGFLHHVVSFPIYTFLYMLPWGLFLWVPFCLALRPLEPKGSLCGFLRSAVLTLFVLFWLLPGYSSLLLLPVLPLMAVMTSFTLPIVLHRQERTWRRALRLASILGGILLFYTGIHWLLAAGGKIALQMPGGFSHLKALAAALAVVAFALAVVLWTIWRRADCMAFGWTMAGFRLWWILLVSVTFILTGEDRKMVANQIVGRVTQSEKVTLLFPEEETLYFLAGKRDFSAQMFYTDRLVQRIKKGDELPQNKEVYVIAENQPVFPGWNWEKLTGPVDFQLHQIVDPSPLMPVMFQYRQEDGTNPQEPMDSPKSFRNYTKKPVPLEDIPEYARKYYLPIFMNLYRGNYKKPE